MLFNQEKRDTIKDLLLIARNNLNIHDKRVVNSLSQMFEIVFSEAKQFKKDDYKLLPTELNDIANNHLSDYIDEYIIACLNTAQYENALSVIEDLRKFQLISQDELASDQAVLYARLNNSEKAEEILLKLLEKNPNDLWHYIKLGDIYNIDTSLSEHRDYKKAEAWYYKAYDNKISIDDEDNWFTLLERLASTTVMRLRYEAGQKCLQYLQANKIGGLDTLHELKNNIYISGSNSIVLAHLQNVLLKKCNNLDEVKESLTILNEFYNLSAQRDLDGLSPFEVTHFMPPGEHELRILGELEEALQEVAPADINEGQGAFLEQDFLKLQADFLKQKDKLLGKSREKVIKAERGKTKKEYEDGIIIWEGFTDYRLTG